MRRAARRAAVGIAAAWLAAAPAGAARGAEWSVAPIAGAIRIDDVMADYRWDLGPVGLVGAAARVGSRRLSCGARVWHAETTQETGIPGASFAPDVGLTAYEATLRWGAARAAGFDLAALGSGGRLRVGFDPDRLLVSAGGVEGIEIEYEPVDTWTWGAGLEVTRRVARRLEAGAAVERIAWRMDAAHRDGDEVREERIGTGAWAVRVALSLGVGGGPNSKTR